MQDVMQFLVEHGYEVLFIWILLDQIGLPFPAAPGMLAAGALAGLGELQLGLVFGVALLATLPADLLWYAIGRSRGSSVLGFLCRISLEPDSCVRRTEQTFARRGFGALVVAKFVPGLETVAPPLAGAIRMRFSRFLVSDIAGTILWSITFIGLGYVFHDQLQRLSQLASELGGLLVVIVGAVTGTYLLWKYVQRRRFIRSLRIARITPDELKRKLEAGEEVEIVDLRHSIEYLTEPATLPGARFIPVEEIDDRHHEIPRDRDVILSCA